MRHTGVSQVRLQVCTSVLVMLVGVKLSTAQVSSFPQLAELTDNPQIQFEELGTSVAISGDVAVVGANNEGSLTGAAYVFVKAATGWTNMTQTATLTASDGVAGDGFGQAVAISGDTIVVAAQNLSAVYLYVKPANGWTNMTQTAKLTASEPTSRFGLGLAISGNTVVVGAYGTNQEGTAYVYEKPATGWVDTQQTGELMAVNKGDFGTTVGVSENTIVVGAPTAYSQDGVVYVYTRPSGGWRTVGPTAELATKVRAAGANFGAAISISHGTVIVGALTQNQLAGKAYVFVEPQGGWKNMTETADLEPPTGTNLFGVSVGISGNAVVIGAPGYFSYQSGTAFIFVKPTSGWRTTSHFNSQLQSSDSAAEDGFGTAVAISGVTVLVGAPQLNVAYGAAYIF